MPHDLKALPAQMLWSCALISLVDLKPGTLRNIPLLYYNHQDWEEYLCASNLWLPLFGNSLFITHLENGFPSLPLRGQLHPKGLPQWPHGKEPA